MSIRNLDHLLDPRSVAVFGASARKASVGATVWKNLRAGGFSGPRYAVNPRHRELDGEPVFARASDLPTVPDLALICTPAATVAELIAELGALGSRAAIVLSAGLDSKQRAAMLAAAKPHLLRILGPNCIGLLAPHNRLNASFAHTDALPGELAFVSQSGALVTAMLDWARSRAIGFSHFVSLGEHADVDFGDMLDYLASDERTAAILLYVESIESPRKFMSAARAAARNKPVILVKAGRSTQGQLAAASHTGALAGSDMVYEAAIARAGMLRVDTLQQLFLAAETLTRFRGNLWEELTILTNGGGAGVMAADAASHAGIKLYELSEATKERLDASLPANWSRANPIDIIGDAPVERYVSSLEALNDDPGAGAVLFIHAPTAIVPSLEIARAMLPLVRTKPPGLMACWLGEGAVAQARQAFQRAGIATYPTPEEAVRAFAMLVAYRRNQAELTQAPHAHAPSLEPDRSGEAAELVRGLLRDALAKGRDMLTEPEAKAVLGAYGIPVVATTQVAALPEAAADAAQRMGFPVVLKILSDDISHKSDVGGVVLNLESAAQTRDAATSMLDRVRAAKPEAKIDGFTVQAMVRRKHAREVIVGASIDNVFGPTLLFGQGGTAVEVVADRAIALPPLNRPLARALVQGTRFARLLEGYRDTPAIDMQALLDVLLAASRMLEEIPELAELDINPLIVNHEGAIALDARIRVSAAKPAGADNFAIRPYPAHLVQSVRWQGQDLTLRPIRPEDEEALRNFLATLPSEERRLPVFSSRRSLSQDQLARLTQIDYEREMSFVALAEDRPGVPQILGAVRALIDPDNIDAEFSVVLRPAAQAAGLGKLLLRALIATLREHGTRRLFAMVDTQQAPMLALARSLDFVVETAPAVNARVRIELVLTSQGDTAAGVEAGHPNFSTHKEMP